MTKRLVEFNKPGLAAWGSTCELAAVIVHTSVSSDNTSPYNVTHHNLIKSNINQNNITKHIMA